LFWLLDKYPALLRNLLEQQQELGYFNPALHKQVEKRDPGGQQQKYQVEFTRKEHPAGYLDPEHHPGIQHPGLGENPPKELEDIQNTSDRSVVNSEAKIKKPRSEADFHKKPERHGGRKNWRADKIPDDIQSQDRVTADKPTTGRGRPPEKCASM